MTLEDARHAVRRLLGQACGDADMVYRAIGRASRRARSESDEEEYALLLLALCDITQDAKYRL